MNDDRRPLPIDVLVNGTSSATPSPLGRFVRAELVPKARSRKVGSTSSSGEDAATLDARQKAERREPWFLRPVVRTIKLPMATLFSGKQAS